MFYQILQHLHSINRWVVLVFLILAIISAFQGWSGTKTYTESDRKKALFAFIFTHVQLVLGLILYFISPYVSYESGVMKDKLLRFYTVEHFSMMMIAIILITIGYSVAKRRKTDQSKFRTTGIYYLIGLIIILASIPWPFREGLGGGWY
jgi:membrane protein implicated in regulation of membrane protease activity